MWDLLFYPAKVAMPLLLPPTGLVLLAVVALLLLRRWPRTATTTLWLSCLTLVLLSLPVVAQGLLAALNAPSLDAKARKSAQAVVILGGGLRRATPEYGDTLSSHALERTRYGAVLSKQVSLPILVTGGQVHGGTAEAEVMAKVLTDEFHASVRWIENRSRHTRENAQYSAALLNKDGIRTVLLVTHDYHMRRALAHCKEAGLICWPAPVSSRSTVSDSWIEQLPNASALSASSMYLHEVIGLFAMQWL